MYDSFTQSHFLHSSFTYNFGAGWEIELMQTPRVMPDSVLLPNGMVVILNGAKSGTAGNKNSNDPNLSAELYDPDAVNGERFTLMANSR
jgi:hypothetical protein